MKTVTGKLVSTKPISLSNAAKYIYRFTSSDTGASHAVSVYLQRTSDSFNNLVQFQKKLKGSHSRREEQVFQLLDLDAKVEALSTADENLQRERRDKKKKRKENEREQEEESIGGVGVQKQNSREVDTGESVGLADQSGKKKGNKVNGDDKIKQRNVESKGEVYRVEEGSVEMRGEKKKKKKSKGEEAEKSFGGEEGKNMKGTGVDCGETVNLAEQIRKNRGREENDGNDKIKQNNMEVKGDMDRVEEGGMEMKDKKKKIKKTEGEEVQKSFPGEKGKKRKSREVDGGETVDLTEQTGKKKKKRKIEGEGK